MTCRLDAVLHVGGIHKGRPRPRGEGGFQPKMDKLGQGGGGSGQNGRPFYQSSHSGSNINFEGKVSLAVW